MDETAPGGPALSTAQIAGRIRRATLGIRDHYSDARNPSRAPNDGEKRKASTTPDPMPAHILDARRNTHADLLHYTRAIQFLVVGMDGQHIRTRVDGNNPFELAGFIDRWAEVFATQDEAEATACARDLTKHAERLEAIVEGPRRVRVDVGLPCPEHGTTDLGERVPCSGHLRALFRLEDDGRRSEGICCTDDDTHKWAVIEWLMLGRRLGMSAPGESA